MALNVDRLLEELRFITIHPDKHNQGQWAEAMTEVELPEGISHWNAVDVEAPRPSACGSFGCLAGNTALHEDGVELDWYQAHYNTENGKKIQIWQADNILNEFVTRTDWYDGSKFKKAKSINIKAMEILDLTRYQAGRLFDGGNTLDTLWQLADEFSGGEIIGNKYDRYSTKSYGLALEDRDRVQAQLQDLKD